LDLQKGNQGQVEQITTQVEATSESLRRIQMEHSQKIDEMNKAYASISKTLLKMGITVGESEEKQRKAAKLINISSDPSLSGSMVFFFSQIRLRSLDQREHSHERISAIGYERIKYRRVAGTTLPPQLSKIHTIQ